MVVVRIFFLGYSSEDSVVMAVRHNIFTSNTFVSLWMFYFHISGKTGHDIGWFCFPEKLVKNLETLSLFSETLIEDYSFI